jgi:predicted O-linked N-acetylglucosamine transferase (SPINDLY family)
MDRERLRHYRKNLRQMAWHHGLADPDRFARKLEASYAEMMKILHEKSLDVTLAHV